MVVAELLGGSPGWLDRMLSLLTIGSCVDNNRDSRCCYFSIIWTVKLVDGSELVGLPDHCEEVLNPPDGQSILCLAFNPAGTLLATGCMGGVILIWDYQTRGLIRTWKPDSR